MTQEEREERLDAVLDAANRMSHHISFALQTQVEQGDSPMGCIAGVCLALRAISIQIKSIGVLAKAMPREFEALLEANDVYLEYISQNLGFDMEVRESDVPQGKQ